LKTRRIEKNSQHLRIGGRGPARRGKQNHEHEKTSEETSKKVEAGGADHRREKEQLAFHSQMVSGLFNER